MTLGLGQSKATAKSVPACNSATFPGCVKDAKSAAFTPTTAPFVVRQPYITNDPTQNKTIHEAAATAKSDFEKNGVLAKKNQKSHAQAESVPACNSAIFPGCVKDAKTAAPKGYNNLPEDMVPAMDERNSHYPDRDANNSYHVAQLSSIPACNSADFPDCLNAKSAAFTKAVETPVYPNSYNSQAVMERREKKAE